MRGIERLSTREINTIAKDTVSLIIRAHQPQPAIADLPPQPDEL
jgi:hypothetical protein